MGLLLALGEQALPNDQLGALFQGGAGLAGGAVHPADLGGVHLQHRVLLEEALGHRVDGADARALARAHMLFDVLDPGGVATVVDAAAGHNVHVAVLADIEVVVHQVVHVPVGDAGGDGHGLPLGAGLDVDVQAGQVLFGVDLDVLGGLAARAAPVLPDIEGAFKTIFPIGNQFQQFFSHAFHANTASLLAQPPHWALPAISPGKISWAGPFSFNWPPEMTTNSSAICRIRSWWEMMMRVPCTLPRRLWNTSIKLVKLHRSMPASGSSNRESRVWRQSQCA